MASAEVSSLAIPDEVSNLLSDPVDVDSTPSDMQVVSKENVIELIKSSQSINVKYQYSY